MDTNQTITRTIARIQDQIAKHPMILYMKGTPQFPQCGFSGQVVQLLKLCKAEYAYVNILENPDIRSELPKYANWPTFPQLWKGGVLLGGCDILTELYDSGDLIKLIIDSNLQKSEPIITAAD